jgi:hypothetical protein
MGGLAETKWQFLSGIKNEIRSTCHRLGTFFRHGERRWKYKAVGHQLSSRPSTRTGIKTMSTIDGQNQILEQISATSFGPDAVLKIVPPAKLHLLRKNARYFKKATFRQLVENIKKDRRLSSVPWKPAINIAARRNHVLHRRGSGPGPPVHRQPGRWYKTPLPDHRRGQLHRAVCPAIRRLHRSHPRLQHCPVHHRAGRLSGQLKEFLDMGDSNTRKLISAGLSAFQFYGQWYSSKKAIKQFFFRESVKSGAMSKKRTLR